MREPVLEPNGCRWLNANGMGRMCEDGQEMIMVRHHLGSCENAVIACQMTVSDQTHTSELRDAARRQVGLELARFYGVLEGSTCAEKRMFA